MPRCRDGKRADVASVRQHRYRIDDIGRRYDRIIVGGNALGKMGGIIFLAENGNDR